MAILDFVNDYGADPTGVTDCSQLLRNALDPTYSSGPGNAVRQTLYFPKGTYKIDTTSFTPIKLPAAGIILTGDGQFGTTNVNIVGNNSNVGSTYLFEWDHAYLANHFPRIEIHNLAFLAENILDLRLPNNTYGQNGGGRSLIYNCQFSGQGDGIAINMLKHDFSIIADCNFYGFTGFCAIRMMGWLDVDSYAGNRATTEVAIRDCVFSSKSVIGISCELVDSIKITGNDFGSTEIPVDVGGTKYWEKIQSIFSAPDRANHYYRGAADVSSITWNNNTKNFITGRAGTGWFSNVNLRDNHLEGFKHGVYINGSFWDHNHGTRIESNNFQNPANNGIMIDLKRVNALSTFSNELYYGSEMTAKGIQYEYIVSCRFILDNFYGNTGPNTNGYVPVGSDIYSPIIWRGNEGGFYAASASAKFDSDLLVRLGATGALTEKTFSIEQRISKLAYGMNQNSTLDLMTMSSRACGTVTLYVYNSIGTFTSVWAIGTDAITRISTESNTGTIYSLSKIGGKLQYKQVHAQTNVDTFVTGIFTGIQ